MTDETKQDNAENIYERLARLEELLGAHNTYLNGQIKERNAAREQMAQRAQQAEMQKRRGAIAEAMSGYADQPSLQGAVNFIGRKWSDEAAKYGMAPEDINRGVAGGLEKLAHAALDNKMNPAHLVYQYALSQGFKPAEAAKAAEQAAEAAAEGESDEGAEGAASAGGAGLAGLTVPARGLGFVEAVKAGKRPAGGLPAPKGNSYKAALAAKAAGNLDEYARLMAG